MHIFKCRILYALCFKKTTGTGEKSINWAEEVEKSNLTEEVLVFGCVICIVVYVCVRCTASGLPDFTHLWRLPREDLCCILCL